MSAGNPIIYDDDWIIANWQAIRNWKQLQEAYNSSHSSRIGYATFKAHCNMKLGLNFMYTQEQEEWLKENFPKLGRIATTQQFNKRFGTSKTVQAIKVHCVCMGLRVTNDRRSMTAIENTGRYHPVGTIVLGSHDEPYVKTDEGWKRLKEIVCHRGKGKVVIHLDGNPANCDPDNLMAVTRAVLIKMSKNRFWSEEKEITRTGVCWCELSEAIREKGGLSIKEEKP